MTLFSPDKQPSNNSARLVSGTAMKNDILKSYHETFGSDYPNPNTTNSLGMSTKYRLKPEEDKYYGLTDLTIWNAVALVVNSFLCVKDLLSLSR